jgi:tetratricopeptide (TPR) repeat protein
LPDTTSGDPLYAALLLEHNALPSVDGILDEETLRILVDEGTGIAAAGLLVSWLREVGGRELVARAYVSPRLDGAQLLSWLGKSDKPIETAFRSWVTAQAARGQTELAFRQAEAVARQAASQRDLAGQIAALTRALTYRPDHPETLYKLALAQMKQGLDDEAERTLRRLVGLEVESGDARYVTFGHFHLGKLYASRGEADRAETELRRVLQRPDRHGSHRMAQEALKEMAEDRDRSTREAKP